MRLVETRSEAELKADGAAASSPGLWAAIDEAGTLHGSPSGLTFARREGWDDPGHVFRRRLLQLGQRSPEGSTSFEMYRGAERGLKSPLLLCVRRGRIAGRSAMLVATNQGAMPQDVPPTSGDEDSSTAEHRPGPDLRLSRATWRTDENGRLFGLARADAAALGTSDDSLLSEHVPAVGAALERERSFVIKAVPWRRVDGSVLPVDVSGTPVHASDGRSGYRGFLLYRAEDCAGRAQDARPAADEPGTTGSPAAIPPEAAANTMLGVNPAPSRDDHSFAATATALPAILNAIVDVSLTGWSQLMNTLPPAQAARDDQPGESDDVTSNPPPIKDVEGRLSPPQQIAEDPAALPSSLSATEQGALSEIARVLGARIESEPPPSECECATVHSLVVPRLREGEMRDALDRSEIAAAVHGRDRILFANRAFLDLSGCADLPALQAAPWLPDLLRTEGSRKPARVALPGVEIETISSPFEWRGQQGRLLLAWRAGIDPATLQQGFAAEIAQRDNRVAELQMALRTVHGGLITVDAAGRITALSGAAQALFGYGENEIAGEQFPFLFAANSRSDAFSLVERARLDRLADGERVPAYGLRRDGSTIELDLSARRTGDMADGSVLVAISDATQQRAMEQVVSAAQRQVEKAHRQAGDLLNRVGHEVRSPLTAIIGFADLLLEERLGPLGDDRLRPYLEGIRSSGLDVVERVDQFKRYTDALTGRIVTAPESSNLNALVSDAVRSLESVAVRERVVVRSSLPSGLPPAWIDVRSVKQAAVHILSAAISMTPPGGQVITATAVSGGEIAWSIRVKDARLTPAEIETVLQPFGERTGGFASPRGGLGLAFAKALIEANGAELAVVNGSEDGPLFQIRFPITAAESSLPATEARVARR